MNATYDPAHALPTDRVRFAVGDTESPWLLDDATIAAAITQAAGSWAALTATDGESDLALEAHGYAAHQALVIVIGGLGFTTGQLAYVGEDATADTVSLSASPGGDAIVPTADGAITVALVQEDRAVRVLAAGLLAKYAHRPSAVSDEGGSQAWAQQLATWRQLASGDETTPRRATGRRWQRGPTPDWTAAEGDA